MKDVKILANAVRSRLIALQDKHDELMKQYPCDFDQAVDESLVEKLDSLCIRIDEVGQFEQYLSMSFRV